jgi:3',5'-cyclic-AMP phosphodiesterase
LGGNRFDERLFKAKELLIFMKEELKFTIFSDVHYGNYPQASSSKGIDGYAATRFFPRFINSLKKSENDFIVNLGDLIGEGGNEKSFRKMVDLFKGFSFPIFNIIGNHELELFNLKKLKRILGLKTSYYYKDFGDYRLVFLNCFDTKTSKPDPRRLSRVIGGKISKRQMVWLRKILNTSRKVIIFSHKLLADQDLSKNQIWNRAPKRYTQIENSEEVGKIIEKRKNVLAVFQGHIHQSSFRKINGIYYFAIQGYCKMKIMIQKERLLNHFLR